MRAWTLISLGDDRTYGGNTGYKDELERLYSYDNTVPNHKRVSPGDLVFLRDREKLIGIAIIENIKSIKSEKIRQRCPTCKTVKIKKRQTIKPLWRCVKNHTFDDPQIEKVSVTSYEATYGDTYKPIQFHFPASKLKAAAIRPNDQLAIEEVDPSQLEAELTKTDDDLRYLFNSNSQNTYLSPTDAETASDSEEIDAYVPSFADQRRKVLRGIKIRRGQKKFRDALIRRYGSKCMISNCMLMDLVEAAHIWPYNGVESNHEQNGLLLRTDIHTLYDLDLLGIDPENLTIKLHPMIQMEEYVKLTNCTLAINGRNKPAKQPLKYRWEAFQQRLRRDKKSSVG